MKWIFIIIMVLICFLCYPNWGSFTESGSGGLIFPIKNSSIIMLNEEIIINISMIGTFEYELSFECNFTFKNMTNSTQTVLMGFPHLQNFWDGPTMDGEKIIEDAIKNILVKADGIMTEVKTYSSSSFSEDLNIPGYNLIIAAEITFNPDETKTMQNIFTMNKHIEQKGHPMGGTAPVSDNKINYILQTGKTWEKPINQADIYINFNNFPDDFLFINGNIDNFKRNDYKNKIHFSASALIPKSDVTLLIELKELELDNALKQIDDYIKKNDIKTVIMLFEKLYEQLPFKTENNIKDKLRKKAYFLAGKIYKNDLESAIKLYYFAMCNTWATQHPYWSGDYIYFYEAEDTYNEWIHEGVNEAPCYYIAYNIACAYSLLKKKMAARNWFEIALQMKPALLNQAKSDKDLTFLFETSPDLLKK